MQDCLKFKYTMQDVLALFDDAIISSICSTSAFQRLRGISFLGAVEKAPEYSKRRHNRFDHSIGVALLAQYYAKKLEFSQKDRIKVVLAALLHDIGHAPLSHSIEPLFAERFGLDHHVATTKILRGEIGLGDDLHSTLSQNSINIDEIISLMAGEDSGRLGCIFSSPINIDTIEAIWRGGTYVHKQFFNPVSVLDAFINKDFKSGSIVDRFWNEKNSFYWLMIYSSEGVAADHWARERIGSSLKALSCDDFYLTEKHFLSKHVSEVERVVSKAEVDIKVRTFEVVDENEVSCYSDLNKRYRVVKGRRSLLLEPPVKKNEVRPQPPLILI